MNTLEWLWSIDSPIWWWTFLRSTSLHNQPWLTCLHPGIRSNWDPRLPTELIYSRGVPRMYNKDTYFLGAHLWILWKCARGETHWGCTPILWHRSTPLHTRGRRISTNSFKTISPNTTSLLRSHLFYNIHHTNHVLHPSQCHCLFPRGSLQVLNTQESAIIPLPPQWICNTNTNPPILFTFQTTLSTHTQKQTPQTPWPSNSTWTKWWTNCV